MKSESAALGSLAVRHTARGACAVVGALQEHPLEWEAAPEGIKDRLADVAIFARSLCGNEKGEAQVFLDDFFRAFGHLGAIEADTYLKPAPFFSNSFPLPGKLLKKLAKTEGNRHLGEDA